MKIKKVMVVDDDAAILDSIKLLLDFQGFDVLTGSRASDIFQIEEDKLPDVILLDMWLSGEDGRDICRELRSRPVFEKIAVIIMSASRGLEQSSIDAGADAFIAKPFAIEDMVIAINKVATG